MTKWSQFLDLFAEKNQHLSHQEVLQKAKKSFMKIKHYYEQHGGEVQTIEQVKSLPFYLEVDRKMAEEIVIDNKDMYVMRPSSQGTNYIAVTYWDGQKPLNISIERNNEGFVYNVDYFNKLDKLLEKYFENFSLELKPYYLETMEQVKQYPGYLEVDRKTAEEIVIDNKDMYVMRPSSQGANYIAVTYWDGQKPLNIVFERNSKKGIIFKSKTIEGTDTEEYYITVKKFLQIYLSHKKPYEQHGGGNCSLCGSPGTTKTTCPLNPDAKNPNPAKHSNATKSNKSAKETAPTAPATKESEKAGNNRSRYRWNDKLGIVPIENVSPKKNEPKKTPIFNPQWVMEYDGS